MSTGDGGLYRRFNYALGTAVEKYCMTKGTTRKVIAVSERVKVEIESEYGVDSRKAVVIHHGVDLQTFHPGIRNRWRDAVRGQFGLGPNDFVAAFVGGDYQRKGLLTLLKALRQTSRPVKAIIIEVVPDKTLRAFIALNHLTPLVRFIGRTSDVAPLYAAADCFVLPTRYDTFSMATLEAMACGLPVLVSKCAGVSELLTHDLDSLLLDDPRDADSLAQHIDRLARDQMLVATFGASARKTAEQHSWDQVAERTLSVYYEALTHPN
jgi:UDP-glucose:(heptosyl)LPS alpha-1,3-glucosyltransferase